MVSIVKATKLLAGAKVFDRSILVITSSRVTNVQSMARLHLNVSQSVLTKEHEFSVVDDRYVGEDGFVKSISAEMTRLHYTPAQMFAYLTNQGYRLQREENGKSYFTRGLLGGGPGGKEARAAGVLIAKAQEALGKGDVATALAKYEEALSLIDKAEELGTDVDKLSVELDSLHNRIIEAQNQLVPSLQAASNPTNVTSKASAARSATPKDVDIMEWVTLPSSLGHLAVKPPVPQTAFNSMLIKDPAIIKLLAERVEKEEKYKKELLAIIEKSKQDSNIIIAAANAITILNAARISFSGRDLRGIKIAGADLSYGLFDGTDFSGADLKGVKFIQAFLGHAILNGANMQSVEFGERAHIDVGSRVFCIAYSPDGKVLASGSEDGTVKLWDVASGRNLATLEGHSGKVYSVVFSSDGKVLASGSRDKTVKLWDIASGRNLATLKGHSNSVRSVVFSSDGKVLASGSDDNIVKLWDVASGHCLTTLTGFTGGVYSVVFSADGNMLVTGSSDRSVKCWNIGRFLMEGKQPQLVWSTNHPLWLEGASIQNVTGLAEDSRRLMMQRGAK